MGEGDEVSFDLIDLLQLTLQHHQLLQARVRVTVQRGTGEREGGRGGEGLIGGGESGVDMLIGRVGTSRSVMCQ